jgi:hypothetical protein
LSNGSLRTRLLRAVQRTYQPPDMLAFLASVNRSALLRLPHIGPAALAEAQLYLVEHGLSNDALAAPGDPAPDNYRDDSRWRSTREIFDRVLKNVNALESCDQMSLKLVNITLLHDIEVEYEQRAQVRWHLEPHVYMCGYESDFYVLDEAESVVAHLIYRVDSWEVAPSTRLHLSSMQLRCLASYADELTVRRAIAKKSTTPEMESNEPQQ